MIAAFLMVLLGSSLQSPPKPAVAPPPNMKWGVLVVLTDPASPKKASESEVAKLQADHLKFLERLWAKRKAFLVGPLGDAKPFRGIVALDVDTVEAGLEIMRQDPYVKGEYLDMKAMRWLYDPAYVARGPKFMDLQSMWFGFFKRNPSAPTHSAEELKAIGQGHMANLEKMGASGDLVLAGPLDDPEYRGVVIFSTESKERVESMLSEDPAVRKGRLTFVVYRWWTAKGTFPKK